MIGRFPACNLTPLQSTAVPFSRLGLHAGKKLSATVALRDDEGPSLKISEFGKIGLFCSFGSFGSLGFLGSFGSFGFFGILGLRFAWTGPGAIPLFILKMWLNDFRAGRFQHPLRSPALGIGRDGDSLNTSWKNRPSIPPAPAGLSNRKSPAAFRSKPAAHIRSGLGEEGIRRPLCLLRPICICGQRIRSASVCSGCTVGKRKQPPAISATVSRDAADDSLRRNG